MKKLIVGCVATVALGVVPALAGVYYEATTTAVGRKGADMQNAAVKAWAAGDKAKIVFETSKNPMMKPGMYMLTRDGGGSVIMVNPENKNYFKWDIDSITGMAGGMMKMMNLKVSDPQVEKVSEEDGGLVAGLPTVHYTYRIAYTSSMKFMMIHKTSKVIKTQEVWSAPRLLDAALGIYLRKTPPKMGDEQFDKLVRAQMDTMKGFPLKMKTVQTDTDEKGKSETVTITMEVTKLQLDFATPDSTFEIPAGYEEVEMSMPGMEPSK